MNKIIFHDGFGTGGSTAVYEYDIQAGTWSTLATARPNPAGTVSANKKAGGCFDGSKGYFLLADKQLYSHDPSSDTWSAALATLSGTIAECDLASDGVEVGILAIPESGTAVTLWLYSIADGALTSIGITSDLLVVSDGAICWDGGTKFYVCLSQSSSGNIIEVWEFDLVSRTATKLATSSAISGSTANLVRGVCYHSGDLYLLLQTGAFYKYDIAAGTFTALTASGFASNLKTGPIFAVSDTDILAVGDSNSFKKYRVDTGTWSNLAALPSTLGDWSAGYFTLPITENVEWRDSDNVAIDGAATFGNWPLGGVRTEHYKLAALVGLSGVTVHAPPATADTTYSVSADNVSFGDTASLGDMLANAVADVYIRAETTVDGQPGARTFQPRVSRG